MRPLLLALALVAATASGQDKPASAPVPAASAGGAPQEQAYSYNPDGRRDPFVSLLRRGVDGTRLAGGKPVEGAGGLIVSELVLKGIMMSRGAYVALIQGPDNKTYLVRVNDRLLDGSVRAISADTLTLLQDVNDPLSLTKQREVRKSLRAAVEQK